MAAACFLLYAMVQFRDSILMRPHPAFWRVIHAMAILYCTSLVFLLMQAKELGRGYLAVIDPALGALFICRPHVLSPPKSHSCNVLVYLHRQRTAVGEPEGICHSEELGYGGGRGLLIRRQWARKLVYVVRRLWTPCTPLSFHATISHCILCLRSTVLGGLTRKRVGAGSCGGGDVVASSFPPQKKGRSINTYSRE